MSNEKKDNGLCTACAGKGYVQVSKGAKFFNGFGYKPIVTLHTLSLCPFCKGTGNSDISREEDKTILKKPNGKEWVGHELTANEYQELASRTINKDSSSKNMLDHALFGMVGEVGEIHSIFQKELQGHPIDLHDLKNEVGDLLWFVSELCTYYGWDLSDVMAANIKKLMERYPDGFDSDRSVNREDYAKQEEIKKELTYGDIFSKCMEQHPELKGKVSDYRPADPGIYGSDYKENSIVIWLTNGARILYYYDGKDCLYNIM